MLHRRAFGSILAASAISPAWPRVAPAVFRAEGDRPAIAQGVASGDVGGGSAVVWSRTDRPSRMVVEWSTTDSFRDSRLVVGPATLPEDDFAAKVVLTGLPPGQRIAYRVTFRDLASPKARSYPAGGQFRTPTDDPTAGVRFAWGGDVAGQEFGINTDIGGMRIFDSIRRARPDFFLHSGDHIYADGPIPAEVRLDDGAIWKNLTTPETAKVAETLDEFRGRYRYNLLDDNVRRFNAEVPTLAQWDDHEVLNNWYPGEWLDDARYSVKSVDLLAARARRAFADYIPTRVNPDDPARIYRSVKYGPRLEVFLLDMRTYRGANSPNRQPAGGEAAAFLGDEQLRWLADGLKASRATWKVVAADQPLGLVVGDGPKDFEALANGDAGPPLGRELELARLLGQLKAANVRNVVWLTADVHYAAAHHYDPGRARFTDFDPFWEFVAGPLNAGTFGPDRLDPTFGPEVKFLSIPPGMKPKRPPSEGLQFFGTVAIEGRTGVMTVALHEMAGKTLYSVNLDPAG